MPVRHYYYTSYISEQLGHAGFQIKAMSPDISSEQQALLARLIDYRIPPMLDARAIKTHPVSLRYYYRSSDECLLLAIHSSGSDEYGRPGNFFVHAIVLDVASFHNIPPIFTWHSPFWRRSDEVERDEIVSLPVQPSLDIAPALRRDDLWRFLEQGQRRQLLYSLLCAVVESSKTQRRIVILGSDEHVTYWIAIVSALLPPSHRPLLTFATYHHDPRQARYLITGTTSNFISRFSAADEQNYVILNSETGVCSEVEPSPYARLATEAARPGYYETTFLPLCETCAQHFPTPRTVDEHLDQIALYAGIQTLSHQSPHTKEEYTALIEQYIPPFFYHPVSPTLHAYLIQTLFPRELETTPHFWEVYQETLLTLLMQPETAAKAVEMLDFWFTVSPEEFPIGYPVQEFFLTLSRHRQRLHQLWSQQPSILNSLLTSYNWYDSIQPLFMETPSLPASADFQREGTTREHSFSALFARYMSPVFASYIKERVSGNQNKARQSNICTEPSLEDQIRDLFAGPDIIKQHSTCTHLRATTSYARFWSLYWKHFSHILISGDVERVLTLFDFWFNHSYQSANTASFLLPEFFLGMHGVLEAAALATEFPTMAYAIDAFTGQDEGSKSNTYPWYPIVQHYFGR